MTIDLTREQEQLLNQQLAAGHFATQDEAIDEALTLLQRRGDMLKQLHADIQEGLDDLKAGRSTRISTPEEAKAFAEEIKQRGRELHAQQQKSAP